jgi:hypothetical protein
MFLKITFPIKSPLVVLFFGLVGRILKHGLHVWKHVALTGFENVFSLKNIIYIRSHLSKKDKTITKKR